MPSIHDLVDDPGVVVAPDAPPGKKKRRRRNRKNVVCDAEPRGATNEAFSDM